MEIQPYQKLHARSEMHRRLRKFFALMMVVLVIPTFLITTVVNRSSPDSPPAIDNPFFQEKSDTLHKNENDSLKHAMMTNTGFR